MTAQPLIRYDADRASVSGYTPGEDTYAEDMSSLGLDAGGQAAVAIGVNEPDVVLYGSRDELIRIARDMLTRLGG